MKTAEQWIHELGLSEHPEGGFYREAYRSELFIEPEGFNGGRNVCTHIYYLLKDDQVSLLHRIKSDEIWHFYAGTHLEVSMFNAKGAVDVLNLSGEEPCGVVPSGAWFGAWLPEGGFALVGCTVAPGFDFSDFEMAEREAMLSQYPAHQAVISRLTLACN